MDQAADRIERFLADHPDGDLLICVGYASAAGVAWLADRTRARRVCLLIGNTQPRYWERVSAEDRRTCLEFLDRADVEVRNWYRTSKSRQGEASAHLKVWATHTDWRPEAVLAGSGNLTRRGLDDNVEVMVEATGEDLQSTWDTAKRLWGQAWECQERIVGYLTQRGEAVAAAGSGPEGEPRRWHAPPQTVPSPPRSRRPPEPSGRNRRALLSAAAAVVGLLLIIGVGLQFRDASDTSIPPPPSTASGAKPAEPETQDEALTEPVPRAEADSRQAAVDAARDHALAAEAATAEAAAVGERVEPLTDSILSVTERKNRALGRVMVAEDCAAKASANARAASSAPDAARAQEIADQAAVNRECAEVAVAEALRWAADAELWLAAECTNDYYNHGSHLPADWGPGWEFGCEAHIPEAVPCVFVDPTGGSYLKPGYVGAAGECRANVAILSRPDGWYECLPDDGSRWHGDWTADPINGRDPCP